MVFMLFSQTERALVITKRIFDYYNTDFSLEMTSNLDKAGQKPTFAYTN